jgi:hypothetical protein
MNAPRQKALKTATSTVETKPNRPDNKVLKLRDHDSPAMSVRDTCLGKFY